MRSPPPGGRADARAGAGPGAGLGCMQRWIAGPARRPRRGAAGAARGVGRDDEPRVTTSHKDSLPERAVTRTASLTASASRSRRRRSRRRRSRRQPPRRQPRPDESPPPLFAGLRPPVGWRLFRPTRRPGSTGPGRGRRRVGRGRWGEGWRAGEEGARGGAV